MPLLALIILLGAWTVEYLLQALGGKIREAKSAFPAEENESGFG